MITTEVTLRDHDGEVPSVRVGTTTHDQVAVVLDPAAAEVLARVLIHFDRLQRLAAGDGETIEPALDVDLWTHIGIDLLTSAAYASLEVPAPAYARLGAHHLTLGARA